MMLAKDLKELFNKFPDDMPVSLGDAYDCDIVGYSISTEDWRVRLKLTDGYGIVTDEFINSLSELEIIACIAWLFRCDHWDNGFLISEVFVNGTLLKYFQALLK